MPMTMAVMIALLEYLIRAMTVQIMTVMGYVI
jgi:hypothetical protein